MLNCFVLLSFVLNQKSLNIPAHIAERIDFIGIVILILIFGFSLFFLFLFFSVDLVFLLHFVFVDVVFLVFIPLLYFEYLAILNR